MFIVRYGGGGWDNPAIAFVTEDEALAKRVIEIKKQAVFDKNRKSDLKWTKNQKAKYELSKLLVAAPNIKETLGEDEYKYLQEEVEGQTQNWEYSEKRLNKTIDEFPFNDWFYEEVPTITSLDMAMKIVEELGDRGY